MPDTMMTQTPVQWFSRFDGPFQFHGTCTPHTALPMCRMEPGSLTRMSGDVRILAWNTAGVRLRFATDSRIISLKARLSSGTDMSHMPRTGSAGFDLYAGSSTDCRFLKGFAPEAGSVNVVGQMEFDRACMRDIMLNFPLYNGVEELELGLEEGAGLRQATPYAHTLPILFYGSSITQGACASRPGNACCLMLSRLLDSDVICLGFSGGAKGEPEMAEYISGVPMGVFVMDYDYNAPDAEHLKKTHYEFFRAIRARNPELPVVMTTRPNYEHDSRDADARRFVILDSYRRALASGDENVYFIDGERMFGTFLRDSCTMDCVHPNDLGFARMAEAMYPTLYRILNR